MEIEKSSDAALAARWSASATEAVALTGTAGDDGEGKLRYERWVPWVLTDRRQRDRQTDRQTDRQVIDRRDSLVAEALRTDGHISLIRPASAASAAFGLLTCRTALVRFCLVQRRAHPQRKLRNGCLEGSLPFRAVDVKRCQSARTHWQRQR